MESIIDISKYMCIHIDSLFGESKVIWNSKINFDHYLTSLGFLNRIILSSNLDLTIFEKFIFFI